MKHPQTFQYSLHPQHTRSTANKNSERRSRLDHAEIRGVYKPAQRGIKQDSPASCLRDTCSPATDPQTLLWIALWGIND